MSVFAFVQARMGSTRLPGKVLEPVEGEPLLVRILERLGSVRQIHRVVVVTSDLERDVPVVDVATRAGTEVFRGSELDVLDRFARAADAFGAGAVVRVTADCPLVDPELVASLIDRFEAGAELDYVAVATGAVAGRPGFARFPDGLDAEVISANALAAADAEAVEPYDREHVTPFVSKRPERFPAMVVEADHDYGDERWTVDHPADLEFVRAVYGALGPGFGYRDVLDLLRREPSLRDLNADLRVRFDDPAP